MCRKGHQRSIPESVGTSDTMKGMEAQANMNKPETTGTQENLEQPEQFLHTQIIFTVEFKSWNSRKQFTLCPVQGI